jgi:ABC-2 type transport system ATP-binding protein
VLQVESLAKRYGDVWAVRELSLKLAPGRTLVLLGQNGAGKTTALRCLSGLLQPTGGRVLVGGVDSRQDPDAVRAQVGLVPEVPGLYERMSARAYLDYFGRVYELDTATRSRRIGELLDLFGLSEAGERWLGTFSKGMRQKVALIRATLHRPRLVLADEPTSALDPDSARIAWSYLENLRGQGAALVVCTHNMEEAQALAGEIGIMAGGRLLASGDLHALARAAGLKPRREVVERPTLEEVYLAIVGNRERDEARPA